MTGIIFNLTPGMRELRLPEVRECPQAHLAVTWGSRNVNLASSAFLAFVSLCQVASKFQGPNIMHRTSGRPEIPGPPRSEVTKPSAVPSIHLQCAGRTWGCWPEPTAARDLGEFGSTRSGLLPASRQPDVSLRRLQRLRGGLGAAALAAVPGRAGQPPFRESQVPAAWEFWANAQLWHGPLFSLTPPVQVTTTDAGNICRELIHSGAATEEQPLPLSAPTILAF